MTVMKNLSLFCLLVICIGFGSCKNNKSETVVKAETPITIECYKALYEKDTLDLKINTLKSGKIIGSMEMAIFGMPKKVGEISGEFHGDTLFASYTFTERGNKVKTFKNPMAFLKRGNELILGNGEIEITMGVSHFVKGKPIDFDRVKYKFALVDCVVK
jgi:hypothetical protein